MQAEKHRKSQVEVYDTPMDIMSNSDVVFSCVTDMKSVKEVTYRFLVSKSLSGSAAFCAQIIFENFGILKAGNLEGKGYIELSTIDEETSADIGSAIRAEGGQYLEAQIQGSKEEAEDGSLIVLCGGEESLFNQCQVCMSFKSCDIHSFFFN